METFIRKTADEAPQLRSAFQYNEEHERRASFILLIDSIVLLQTIVVLISMMDGICSLTSSTGPWDLRHSFKLLYFLIHGSCGCSILYFTKCSARLVKSHESAIILLAATIMTVSFVQWMSDMARSTS